MAVTPPALSRARHPYRDPRLLGLVLVGGALGTFVRYAIEHAFPVGPGAWPWATFVINLCGALVLGALLEGLLRTGPDEGWRRLVRVGVGTGVLGGFTTYSTFAVEADLLVRDGHALLAAGYALGSVVLGATAAVLGMLLAARLASRPARAAVPVDDPEVSPDAADLTAAPGDATTDGAGSRSGAGTRHGGRS